MGTSSSEGEGDYLMPWSRVLNWNRLPGELSSSLSLSLFLRSSSPRRFTHFASFSFHRPSLLFSLPFFLLSSSIHLLSSLLRSPPPCVLRTFPRRGREIVNSRWQNVASPRSYRKRRAKVRRSSAIYRIPWEGKRQESEESRGGEGKRGRDVSRGGCETPPIYPTPSLPPF